MDNSTTSSSKRLVMVGKTGPAFEIDAAHKALDITGAPRTSEDGQTLDLVQRIQWLHTEAINMACDLAEAGV